jgi:hypothetical protein
LESAQKCLMKCLREMSRTKNVLVKRNRRYIR